MREVEGLLAEDHATRGHAVYPVTRKGRELLTLQNVCHKSHPEFHQQHANDQLNNCLLVL